MTKERSCAEVAAYRGRRKRRRKADEGASPVRGEIAFGVTWVASLMTSLILAPFRRNSSPNENPSYRPHQRELGTPGPLRHRQRGTLHGRYGSLPSMTRIMTDLRRPVARQAARDALLVRIGSDSETSAWVAAQLDADDLRRLAVHARSGRADSDIISSWRSEARAEREAAEAEIRARDRAKRTSLEIADEGDEGGHIFAPLGR